MNFGKKFKFINSTKVKKYQLILNIFSSSLCSLILLKVKTKSDDTACASDSLNAPSGSYTSTVLKNDSFASGVVHEEINTTTILLDFKINNGGDGRTIVATAVVQSTASGAPLSIDTVISFNGVSNVNTAFTAATCKTKAVPLLVSYTSFVSLSSFENRYSCSDAVNLTSKYLI